MIWEADGSEVRNGGNACNQYMMDTLLTCVTVDITLPAGKSMMMVTMNVTITSGKVHAGTYVSKGSHSCNYYIYICGPMC